MYVLEYKSLYIPHEERGPLEQIRAAQKRPEEWRIIPTAGSVEQEG